jgi:outer membrane receptor protein involved in Fe transport
MAYTFVGDRDDITPEGTIANHDAFDRVDLSASYAPGIAWKMVRNEAIVARVQNLFDRKYSEAFGFPTPRINFLAGVKLDF